MGKERTKKSKYESRYSGGYITAAQYITEFLCEKIAKRENKSLPDRFWGKPEWNKVFRRQVGLANKLLKEYSSEVILKTLRDKRCNNLTSLGANWLLGPILEEYHRVQCMQEEQISIQEIPNASGKSILPRPAMKGKKSTVSLLRDL